MSRERIQLLVMHALLSAAIAGVVIAAYHYGVASRTRFAVVDVDQVYRAKEAQFSALIAKVGATDQDRDRALKLAQDFALTFPAALESASNECRCVLLVTHAVVGHPTDVLDLTPALRAKVGL